MKVEKLNKQPKRLSGMTTTGNIDILLLELNELQQLDTQRIGRYRCRESFTSREFCEDKFRYV